MLRAKLLAAVAVPALAAGAVSGCAGTSDKSSDKQAPVKSDVLAELVSDVKGSLQKSADSTAAANSVAFSLTGTSAGKKISGTGAISFKPSKVELVVDDGETKATVRFIDAAVYVQLPPEDRADLDGKSWMKMDLTKSLGAGASREFEDVDPTKQIKTLLSGKDVTVVGQEELNGVQTVHYRAKVSLAEYLAQVDAKARAAANKEFSSAGVETMDVDAWVDEQYRPVRLHLLVGSKTDMTMDYTDWGKPVRIAAPPAKDTVDFADLLSGIGGPN